MAKDVRQELDEAIEKILASRSRKKLVVAGPGAGKTTLFEKLLGAAKGGPEQRLVLTFINNLKDDLDRTLGEAARVFTLHGYCQHLLHRHEGLRDGLSADFRCYPGLVSLIKKDWEWLRKSAAPRFVEIMRDLSCPADQAAFYFERANYYDAVDFDDSVYRTYQRLVADQSTVPAYELVLIDEFQDFNKMEAGVIDALAGRNPIVITGDDDQALYSQLRGASWDHIRAHYESGHYDIFELPFCMRCPEVIVAAVSDVITKALARKRLNGRITKPYRYFEPFKGEDSRLYPKIDLVETTVQRDNANYFGKYIEQCIRAISTEDIKQATEKREPVALVIGSDPYRRQVEKHLANAKLISLDDEKKPTAWENALALLNRDPKSNLGWRIVLACGEETVARDLIRTATEKELALADIIPAADRDAILKKAEAVVQSVPDEQKEGDGAAPNVKVTSYEGAKGLSAQFVFLIGLHAGELPRNTADIKDIEICRFLVGLTRTKKKCSALVTKRFADQFKRRSEFLSWIDAKRFEEKKIDVSYWK